MDYLSSMNSDTQMVDSQYTNAFQQDNESGDDYALHTFGFESQANYAQSDNKGLKDPNLESIREEETPFKLQGNENKHSIKKQNLNKNQQMDNLTEFRVQQLSQQLDNLENETQKAQFEPKNGNCSSVSIISGLQPRQVTYDKGLKEGLSSMSTQFRQNIDDMLNRTEKMMDDYKLDICSFIDNHKLKFRKNAEFLKNLLVAETEMVITEEERNKMIDVRMQALFKEMVNILNDYQKRK